MRRNMRLCRKRGLLGMFYFFVRRWERASFDSTGFWESLCPSLFESTETWKKKKKRKILFYSSIVCCFLCHLIFFVCVCCLPRDFQFGHMDGNDYINSLIMGWVSRSASLPLSSHIILLFSPPRISRCRLLNQVWTDLYCQPLPLKMLSCGEVNYTDGLPSLFFSSVLGNFNHPPCHHEKEPHELPQIFLLEADVRRVRMRATHGLYPSPSCVFNSVSKSSANDSESPAAVAEAPATDIPHF